MSSLGRILIVGAAGQVGRELQRCFAGTGELICRDRESVDLAVEDEVRELVRSTSPDLILNAAAYTAVDRAESEPEVAMAINAAAPRVLAEEAHRRDILLVHYSTDYVFDGSKHGPWLETDQPNPLNVYGASKLAGEEAIRQVDGKYLIFRTSWVYGPDGNNFLFTMLRLGRERERLTIVDDQIGEPGQPGYHKADEDFDASKWQKANPLMDVNPILEREIRKAAMDAKQMPGRHAEFKIKRLL